MSRELMASLLPGGKVELEWEENSGKVGRSREHLEGEIYKRYEEGFPPALLFLGFSDRETSLSSSVNFWRDFAGLFTEKLIKTPDLEEVREKVQLPLEEGDVAELLDKAPPMTGGEYLDGDNLKYWWEELYRQFQREIAKYAGTVESFIHAYNPKTHLLGRVYFHLVENKKSQEYPFAFLSTYSTRMTEEGKARHIPLKYALEEYGGDEQKLLELLSTVQEAGRESPFVARLLDTGEIFHPLAWTPRDAHRFLKEVPLCEKSGILCRIPNWWKQGVSSFRANITLGDRSPKFLGLDSLLSFNASLLLGDQVITEKEARKILAESEGLAFIKGKWVEVDRDKLQQVLDALKKSRQVMKEGDLTLAEAMRIELGMRELAGSEEEKGMIEISHGQWLGEILGKLRRPQLIKETSAGKNFKADLRPYQQHGLNWLGFLDSLRLGACLADDMGLGKTIQVLAFLNQLGQKKGETSLLVVPASIMANWQREMERFSPSLRSFIAHPSNPEMKKEAPEKSFLDKLDLVITTYGLVQRTEWIQQYQWNYVILDEAQAIKNPGTKQTRAVKTLHSKNRLALTGTPLENRLGDLWSLFDFLNPGLLGNRTEFKEYSRELEKEEHGYGRLRKVISPYILRRLKTDKSIISDLPDKIEVKAYCDPSKKQILLYQQLVWEIERALEELDGMKRRGLILASLMKFKQICNHPGQYLGNGEFLEKDSGKLSKLREICETILEKREKVLIFTQFKEIIPGLYNFLEKIFGREGLVLHGSVAVSKRKKLIERFQSGEYLPFFILSVKAGGVGLNLTEANHVIHFDRWWNPAVENQATDRAFRIGQDKKVLVHKFITRGTVEEKIDSMLEAKSALFDRIIQTSNEKWITEMDNREILNLFKFSL